MRDLLRASFRAAVAAADPLRVLPPHLPTPPRGRTLVVAAGKAAGAMAAAVERTWPAAAPLDGIALTRYGHGAPTTRIRVIEGGHPLPDEAGASGARAILESVRGVGEDDLLLALLSGGGSALLGVPVEDVKLADLQSVTRQLLHSGAPIQDINVVRKHLAATLGGRLAAASRAPVRAFIISDVTGDDPTHIASGPFAPDPSTYGEALAILRQYAIDTPAAVRRRLKDGEAGRIAETPKPGDPLFARVDNRVIATARRSLEAAVEVFRAHGVRAEILSDKVTGEAVDVAKGMATLVQEIRAHGRPFRTPVALISGGETTVTVRHPGGRGGRGTEFLLSLAVALEATQGVHAIAADTDGIDGTEDNAGAFVAPDTLERARSAGIEPQPLLAQNDSYGFFAALGDLVMTGPTRTNVNEYRAIICT